MLRGSDWLTNCAYSVNRRLTARCSVKLFVIERSGLLSASAAYCPRHLVRRSDLVALGVTADIEWTMQIGRF
jgi:hypothetical protein